LPKRHAVQGEQRALPLLTSLLFVFTGWVNGTAWLAIRAGLLSLGFIPIAVCRPGFALVWVMHKVGRHQSIPRGWLSDHP